MRIIIWYIIERIQDFENKKRKPFESHILIDTILKECKIDMPSDSLNYRKKRTKIILRIKAWLIDAKKHNAIKDYQLFSNS